MFCLFVFCCCFSCEIDGVGFLYQIFTRRGWGNELSADGVYLTLLLSVDAYNRLVWITSGWTWSSPGKLTWSLNSSLSIFFFSSKYGACLYLNPLPSQPQYVFRVYFIHLFIYFFILFFFYLIMSSHCSRINDSGGVYCLPVQRWGENLKFLVGALCQTKPDTREMKIRSLLSFVSFFFSFFFFAFLYC